MDGFWRIAFWSPKKTLHYGKYGVLHKIGSFASFSVFNFFAVASKVFPAEAFADKYFPIFPFQTSLLRNIWMTSPASRSPMRFSHLQEHLQNICLDVKTDLAPQRQFQLYFFHLSSAQSRAWVVACARTGERARSTMRLLGPSGTSRLQGEISTWWGSKISGGWGTGTGVNQREEKQSMEANKKCSDSCLWKEEKKPLPKAEMNALVALRTPRGKAKTPLEAAGAVGSSELGNRQESSPGKTKVPPHPKAAATGVTERSCGMRGWQGSSGHRRHVHFWDLLLEPYGRSPPYPLSPLPVKSGYSGLTVALEINESKVVPAGSILQFGLWSLWITRLWASFFTVTGGILHTALNAVLCKGWGGTPVPNLLKL